MPDSRIKDFTDYYHKAYQTVMGVPYKWKGGKEQKLMQGALKYFEALKKDSDGLEAMKKAAHAYLNSNDKFAIETAYDLSHFLTKPEKWAFQARVKAEEEARRKINEKAIVEQKQLSQDRAIKDYGSKDWLEQMTEDPKKFVKSFKMVHKLMKAGDPMLYDKVKGLMVDFYGKEKLKEYWSKC